MKAGILLIIVLSLMACAHTGDTQKQVSIHPFYPYAELDSLRKQAGFKDSDFSRYYILYNVKTTDTAQLKKILQPYVDSVVKLNPATSEFEFTFYKTGRGFDSSYRETRIDPLFEYESNHIATHRRERRNNNYYWGFFKNGRIITDDSDLKIEDIPKNDSILPEN